MTLMLISDPADSFKDMFQKLLSDQTVKQQVELIAGKEKAGERLKFDRNQPQQHIDQLLTREVERTFTAYCRYLSRTKWHYQTHGGWIGALEAGKVADLNRYPYYSIFLFPNEPTANCYDAALGFLLLLHYLGVPRSKTQLIKLTAGGEDDTIFMRGLRAAVKKCFSYVCYPHQTECVGYEIRPQGDHLTSTPMSQMVMDTPFDNHYFVKYGNMYWDPTYGFTFANPDAVFCSCQSWLLEHPGFGQNNSAQDGIFYAKSVGYWVVNVNSKERKKYLKQGVPGLKIDPEDDSQGYLYFKDTAGKEAIKVQQANRSSLALVPPALAQSIFSIAVFLKSRLMKAVLAYEKNTGFLRSPSLETKTALAQIRRYAGDSTVADASVQKKLYRQKGVQGRVGMHIWTDQEALNFARRARQPGNDLVGKRLQQTLAKAFEGYDYCFDAQ